MDILIELKEWLAQEVQDAPHRGGETPGVAINLIKRAIEEIESLRGKLAANAEATSD